MYPLVPKTDPEELAYEEQVLSDMCEIGETSWGDASAIIEAGDADPIPALFKANVPPETAARQLLGMPEPGAVTPAPERPSIAQLRAGLDAPSQPVFDAVMEAMQSAEEISRPGAEGYQQLMQAIVTEAQTRIANYLASQQDTTDQEPG